MGCSLVNSSSKLLMSSLERWGEEEEREGREGRRGGEGGEGGNKVWEINGGN